MSHNHSNHLWLMIIACGGAFLLTLVLPLIGLSKRWSVGISIAVMVGLHLWIMGRHSADKSCKTEDVGKDHGK